MLARSFVNITHPLSEPQKVDRILRCLSANKYILRFYVTMNVTGSMDHL